MLVIANIQNSLCVAGREKMVLYAEEMDRMTCTVPGCDCGGSLYIHSRCHPDTPTWARYSQGSAVLELLCARCAKVISRVAISVRGAPAEAG